MARKDHMKKIDKALSELDKATQKALKSGSGDKDVRRADATLNAALRNATPEERAAYQASQDKAARKFKR